MAIYKAINKYNARSNLEVFDITNNLNKIGLKVANGGAYSHLYIHCKKREFHYPVLLSTKKVASEKQLRLQLQALISQLTNLPPLKHYLEFEYLISNKATQAQFENLNKNEYWLAAQKKFSDFLKKKNIKAHKLQTLDNLKNKVLEKLTELQKFMILEISKNDVTSTVVEDKILKEIWSIREASDIMVFEMNMKSIMATASSDFDQKKFEEVQGLLSQLLLKQSLNQIYNPSVYGIKLLSTYKTKELLLINQIAARLYELKTQKLPISTEDFVTENILENELIIDPYSQKPLKLLNDGKEIKVYSVYEDFDDDNGGTSKRGGDLVLSGLKNE